MQLQKPCRSLLRDAPLDIWGGGLEFLLLANFFWQSTSDNFFCMFRRRIFLSYAFPFGVFSGQHIFHKFRQQTFFFCPHFKQTFFLTFVAKKIFFLFPPPHPPDIKWCVPSDNKDQFIKLLASEWSRDEYASKTRGRFITMLSNGYQMTSHRNRRPAVLGLYHPHHKSGLELLRSQIFKKSWWPF